MALRVYHTQPAAAAPMSARSGACRVTNAYLEQGAGGEGRAALAEW